MPERPATLRDVAAAARVHPATASRALNPETRILVSEDTARRVSEAAGRLGYRPNPVARSLRTRRSHTVGVLIRDLLGTPLILSSSWAAGHRIRSRTPAERRRHRENTVSQSLEGGRQRRWSHRLGS